MQSEWGCCATSGWARGEHRRHMQLVRADTNPTKIWSKNGSEPTEKRIPTRLRCRVGPWSAWTVTYMSEVGVALTSQCEYMLLLVKLDFHSISIIIVTGGILQPSRSIILAEREDRVCTSVRGREI